ncbi:MAG: DUF2125 domain-containing protein [Pseudomonadota bacterium]
MKKIGIVCVAIAVVAIAAWSGLWFFGKSEVERQIDQQIGIMKQRGWNVTYGDRDIGGFPSGYVVRITDLAIIGEEGALIRLPEVTGTAEAQGLGEVVFDLPPNFTVDLPISERWRAQNVLLPEVLKMQIESKNMKVMTAGVDPVLRSYRAVADQIIARAGKKGDLLLLSAEVSALDAGMSPGPKGRLVRFKAGQIAGTMHDASQQAEPRVGIVFNEPTATATWKARDLLELFDRESPADLIDGAFTSTAQDIYFLTNEAPGQPPLNLTYRAGAYTGLVSAGAGEVRYQAEEREVSATLKTVPELGLSIPEAIVRADVYQRAVTVPLSFPDAKPQSGSFRVSVLGLRPDDALWNELDPENVLDRTPAEIGLDLQSSFMPKMGRRGPPIELANLSVNEFDLSALGARVSGKGDIEVLQPLYLPLGQINVKLDGANGLIDALALGRWIPRQVRDMATAMLQVYARPVGDGAEDKLETEINFETQGIFMNGLKLPD